MSALLLPNDILSLSAQAARRLIGAGNGDGALLYLALLDCGGDGERARKALKWDGRRLEEAYALLARLELVAPDQAPRPAEGPAEPDRPPEYSRADVAAALERDFGSYDDWRAAMKAAALGQFGSGYAWLVCERSGALSVLKTANQDSPLSLGLWPLLCVDVWEHAYYLDYQNRRPDYVERWFERIHWPFVQQRYEQR